MLDNNLYTPPAGASDKVCSVFPSIESSSDSSGMLAHEDEVKRCVLEAGRDRGFWVDFVFAVWAREIGPRFGS